MRAIRAFVYSSALLMWASAAWAQDCQTPQQPTIAGESVTCTTPRPGTVVWRIDQPNVKQRETTYSAIKFRMGDLVSVFAGGCVQTGGYGLTWKRYVNPTARSKGDDDQYHGLIHLPGNVGMQHIRNAVLSGGTPVLADPGLDDTLKLGYLDDNYSDNGYSGQDEGWWQQCNDLPNAWAVIVVQHDCATSAAANCVRGRALDLVVDTVDPNGFPLNPNWVYRVLTGATPSARDVCSWSGKIGGFPVDDAMLCASEPTERDAHWTCVQGGTPGALAGHMNWVSRPITYQGWVWWDNHSWGKDDDYTLNVAALDATGAVSGALFVADQSNPQVEFDSDETIDKFVGAPWWQQLKNAVDNDDQKKHTANATPTGVPDPSEFFPPGGQAIFIGQLGLDCGHGACNTEIHPAWVVFIHTSQTARDDDVWAFFVRNWGDEGWCSTMDHVPGDQRVFTVKLPRLGATDVQLNANTAVASTHPVPQFQVAMAPEKEAALVTFTLPSSAARGLIYGELHLRWKTEIPFKVSNRAAFEEFKTRRLSARAEGSMEEQMQERIDRLPASAQRAFTPVKAAASRAATRRITVTGRVVGTPPAPTKWSGRIKSMPLPATQRAKVEQRGVMLRRLEEAERSANSPGR